MLPPSSDPAAVVLISPCPSALYHPLHPTGDEGAHLTRALRAEQYSPANVAQAKRSPALQIRTGSTSNSRQSRKTSAPRWGAGRSSELWCFLSGLDNRANGGKLLWTWACLYWSLLWLGRQLPPRVIFTNRLEGSPYSVQGLQCSVSIKSPLEKSGLERSLQSPCHELWLLAGENGVNCILLASFRGYRRCTSSGRWQR